ncbi:MAG TPA: glycoside hydrolase family 2 TIM barrel-domain containing protein [Steroidobacteraceae bacterium]|nr:glycoside hydrolase family 2 TIM barrel-domain containing protein [Steroidobacteraceae bacterium]
MTRPGSLVAVLAVLLAAPVLGSTRIDFNQGWLFRTDPERAGESSGWTRDVPAGAQSVSVPHTWNIGEFHDYLGVAWYFRRFAMPPVAPGTHVELHFGATFYRARVWLNGAQLGAHEGGFTAYAFDISRQLRSTNVLVVQIDNRPGAATIPGFGARGSPDAWYDWWAFGGIVRDVWLTASGPAWIRRQSIRSVVTPDRAEVRDRIFLQSEQRPRAAATLRVTAYGPDNQPASSTAQAVDLVDGQSEVAVSLTVSQPKLWSIDRPNVYRMDVELLDRAGKVLDVHSDTFGLRTVQILQRHLLLNGERVRLTGLTRHEDSPWEGLAETRGTMRRDFDELKSLHTTLSRPVHYPQNPFILDYADRHGILLIPEIPVWQFDEAQLSNPAVIALAQRQMQEMIEEAGNHPSIFAWSVANESATATAGGIAYFRAMRDLVRKIDPDRFVSYADDNLPKLDRAEQSAANDADFLMMNQYFGSWHGPSDALVPALDRVDKLFPDKMLIVSEFGFPGFFAKTAQEADQARIKIMQEQMPVLAAREWIAGAILWCYQDYKSRRNLWPGQAEGYVEHGVVDEARQHKPSYDVWRELNAPARIDAQWIGSAGMAGFNVTVTPQAQRNLPYYPLRNYLLSWTAFDEKGRRVAGGEQKYDELIRAEQLAAALPPDAVGHSLHLLVQLLDSTGALAAERALDWPVTRQAGSVR